MAPVTINGNTIDLDPARAPPDYFPIDASGSNYILIQCKGPLTAPQLEVLQQNQVVLHRHEDNNTILCRYEPTDLGVLQDIPFVAHVVVYHPDYVLHPNVHDSDGAIAISLHYSCSQSEEDLWNVIRTEVDPSATLIHLGSGEVCVRLSKNALKKVAEIDCVRSISKPGIPACESFKATQAITGVMVGGGVPPALAHLDGAGEFIAVADTGFNEGRPPWPWPWSNDSARRIVVKNAFKPGSTSASDMRDRTGHGTHVAGIAAGRGRCPPIKNAPGSAGGEFARCADILGSAPQANILSIRAIGEGPLNMGNLLGVEYEPLKTAKLHNHSFGLRARWMKQDEILKVSGYVDTFAGAIDRAMSNDPELLVVQSAGNNGTAPSVIISDPPNEVTQYRQIANYQSSKNAICVGATFNDRSFKLNDETYCMDGETIEETEKLGPKVERSSTQVLALSQKGPTPEGRLKPDVVAPGAGILSTRSSRRSTTLFGNLNQDIHGRSPFPSLQFNTGTSMATPLVSGLAACLRQAVRTSTSHPVPKPSGALIKALLINGAIDLESSKHTWLDFKADTPRWSTVRIPATPNVVQGYGLVNLSRSLASITEYGGVAEGSIGTSQVVTIPAGDEDFIVPPSGDLRRRAPSRTTLRATLVYTDLPGARTQNDLTLSILKTSKHGVDIVDYDQPTLLPWQLPPYVSIPWQPPHPNVQRVTIKETTADLKFKIQISAEVIDPWQPVGPGVSPAQQRLEQPFAIVWAFDDDG